MHNVWYSMLYNYTAHPWAQVNILPPVFSCDLWLCGVRLDIIEDHSFYSISCKTHSWKIFDLQFGFWMEESPTKVALCWLTAGKPYCFPQRGRVTPRQENRGHWNKQKDIVWLAHKVLKCVICTTAPGPVIGRIPDWNDLHVLTPSVLLVSSIIFLHIYKCFSFSRFLTWTESIYPEMGGIKRPCVYVWLLYYLVMNICEYIFFVLYIYALEMLLEWMLAIQIFVQ